MMLRAGLLLLLLLPAGHAAAFDPFGAAGIDHRTNAHAPMDLTFTDQAGRRLSLGQIAGGKPLLLVPVLHRCPNICGVVLSSLAQTLQAQRMQPGRDFAVAAFGLDPRETPADSRASLQDLDRRFPSLPPDWITGLIGTGRDIAAVAGSLGYRYAWDDRIQQYAHVAAIAVLAPDGRLVRWLPSIDPDPQVLKRSLATARTGDRESWSNRLFLLCYHYDPVTGRYTPAIWEILRVAGLVTLLAVGVLILRAARRRPAAKP
jgi:protein SCO1/2